MTGPIRYWHVGDIKQTFARFLAAGAEEIQAVSDLGGRLIATVKDADGNIIGLIQPA